MQVGRLFNNAGWVSLTRSLQCRDTAECGAVSFPGRNVKAIVMVMSLCNAYLQGGESSICHLNRYMHEYAQEIAHMMNDIERLEIGNLSQV